MGVDEGNLQVMDIEIKMENLYYMISEDKSGSTNR